MVLEAVRLHLFIIQTLSFFGVGSVFRRTIPAYISIALIGSMRSANRRILRDVLAISSFFHIGNVVVGFALLEIVVSLHQNCIAALV